ncbi:MAG: hypothetical protein QOE77_1180 [Blastocatellia bacterium]|jgi:hypothetical protein|nr:hypothetical protein [Blastocatellia bacterium]
MDGAILLFEFLAGIYLTIAGAVQKVGFKKRLSKGLGRKVSDEELLSLSAWMRIPDEEKSDAGRRHFSKGSFARTSRRRF